jgi:glycosyltransferase involved in cell wall biosynthesis
MRILFVHEQAGFQGGAEANIHQVATAFRAQGHRVDLLYEKMGAEGGKGFIDVFADHWQFAQLEQALAAEPSVIYAHKTSDLDVLRRLIESGLPIVRMVHDHDSYCQRSSRYFPWNRNICTRRAGYSCAITCGVLRDRDGALPVKLAWPGKKLAEIKLCQNFHTHLVQTDYMKSELELHGFDPESIRVLPVAPQQHEIGRKKNYETPEILFVGQLLRGKGVDFLLRALDKIRQLGLEHGEDWKCTIAGEGSHLDACKHLSAELGLGERVSFVGRLNRAELSERYQRARLGVVPSVWPEPMGMVGLEFMWASLPVVAFDVGGISHWLEDGKTGYLAASKDVDGLARHIARLLDDPVLAEEMGRHARRVAEDNYRHDDYVDQLLEMLEGASEAEPALAAPREFPQLQASTT